MVQGLATYPGVVQVQACRYTRGLSTEPGYAILEFTPQSSPIAAQGTLGFTFGGSFVNLYRCRVDFVSVLYSARQGFTAIAKIWDRRWAWHAGGEIIGRYNVRNADGSIDTDTEKTPQELATLLLIAMQEQNFDVSQLPNDTRPYVNWNFAHPASELDDLCEQLGCRVCLKISSDSVKIERLGVGASLPSSNLFRLSQNGNLQETPDSLKVVGGLARFQSKLDLEAVGLDNDGKIYPINDLSYAPTGGWSTTSDSTFAFVTSDSDRQLAQRTVFKWYRAVSQADGTQNVPDYKDVQDIENIKPIDNFLVETYTDDEGNVLPQDAFVEGEWYNADPQAGVGTGANTAAGTRYEGEFFIDRQNAIVKFPVQVYKLDTSTRTEADLYLTCSYHARDPDTDLYTRWIYNRNLGGTNATGPKIIPREDIEYTTYATYDSGNNVTSTTNNQGTVEQESINQLNASQQEYFPSVSYDAGYNGIVPIEIDGLIRQVTYKVESRDRSPRGGAETYVAVNSETDPYVPRYPDRRLRRRLRRRFRP